MTVCKIRGHESMYIVVLPVCGIANCLMKRMAEFLTRSFTFSRLVTFSPYNLAIIVLILKFLLTGNMNVLSFLIMEQF
ncbi:hypothetical protein ACTXT7_003159 [Hymenolepis weldensis]